PAVVRGAGLLAEPLRLLPRRGRRRPLREQFAHTGGGGYGVGEELLSALRRHVADGEHPRRGARLPEALVVRSNVRCDVRSLPDLDPSVSARDWRDVDRAALRRQGDRANGRQPELVLLLALVAEPPHAQLVAGRFERRDARGLRQAQERRDLRRHLPGLGIGGLPPAENEVRSLLL